ncbi:calcium/sodium antiporter [Ruegeria pomeroyi]|uniref:K+-dependent Na+/Ca+ exchanger related-protein n=2 Tax=Ruegeria pomeroyi TaxID=89184 RepID=Q5LW08_RUEPO|nr:calcium/sodium antiporter [Ruegeria pomeroyi]HCE71498.1 sodium:calcium antiporter [Ruegeria sp.]AAV93852.1 K+-dependent Na+/Ca+ exchanger related-protein [Ruegeria pomeroyi DSS-3]NVK95404.1 calcium/sodium antiporter [Ruegeria pomeroyi]NVL02095.1 calcium/sodium antiporter [Ruegeria pomeroyi]QWV07442.1 calcium/sodium antiporter [Ruegeria pomeroyi]
MEYLSIAAGLIGLFLGGEALVRGSVGLAQRLGLPPLLIGLTVVGFGTSTPELLVSVDAALRGVPDIALGNILGSNIANILLIGGITSLIWPIRGKPVGLWRDLTVMILATLALTPILLGGQVIRVVGLVLLLSLVAYLVWSYRQAGGPCAEDTETDLPDVPARPFVAPALIGAGLLGLMIGARLLVDGAVSVAQGLGVSDAFIGLTIVAVGTSLPELATSVIAAYRRQSEIAVGNIVGSNIFNVLGILGATAVIAPIPVASRFALFDLPVALAAAVTFSVLLLWRAGVSRGAGVLLLLAYAAYVWAAQG